MKPSPPGVTRPWQIALGTVALSLASWLYLGYVYEIWPQPGFLAHVMAFNGQLRGDWFTSLPPGHWAIDHVLGWLPGGALEPAVLVLWLGTLVVLWLGVLLIAESLGASVPAAVTAGLLLIPTHIGGFGVSEALFQFFYPNSLAFALSICAIAAVLRERYVIAGVLVGVGITVHPGLGPLAVPLVAPILVFVGWRSAGRTRAALGPLLRFGAPAAIVGAPAIAQLMLHQTAGAQLGAQEVYRFLTVVRQPHHMLYSAFPLLEYLRTGIWVAGLLAALWIIRDLAAARLVAFMALTIAVVCGLGSIASQTGWPLLLVEAQTSRLSAYLVLFAAIAIVAALVRLAGAAWAAGLAAAVFLLGPWALDRVEAKFPAWAPHVDISTVEAGLMLAVLAAVAIVVRWRPSVARWRLAIPVAALVLAATAVSLLVERSARRPVRSASDGALLDVARHARTFTDPGELVLTPPTLDGFRAYALRPDVVEFGSIRLGQGDAEWKQRVLDLTGDPTILEPGSLGTDLAARQALMDSAYAKQVDSSPAVLCKYRAHLVLTTVQTPVPRWLVPVYDNELYRLLGIRSGTCRST
ncbi:MAG TPA: DUF6798 domain-containing protein [Thermoleophilaceae bacterium]